MSRGGTEREGDTESETRSWLRAVSTEPDAGLEPTNREILTEPRSDAQLTEPPRRPEMIMFAFVSLPFGNVSSKKLLWPKSKRFLLVFSSRILMVSCLTFRPFIHFEFIFFVWCKEVVQFHSFTCCCPVFSLLLDIFPVLSKIS